ncbi:MAG: GIY-YIG nuclease family protein [Candidatus Bathyarchaeota archaeon]|nr:MAG: GIY-YIG nuclease family protein [Candidatus Bathyarchaeota archaeon]
MYEAVVSNYLIETKKLLSRRKYDFEKASSHIVPKEPGVYVIHDKHLRGIVYIGRTRNLKRRLLSDHKHGNVDGSQFRRALGRKLALKSEGDITNYVLENCSFQFAVIQDSEEMIRLEHFATAVLGPILNVQLKY